MYFVKDHLSLVYCFPGFLRQPLLVFLSILDLELFRQFLCKLFSICMQSSFIFSSTSNTANLLHSSTLNLELNISFSSFCVPNLALVFALSGFQCNFKFIFILSTLFSTLFFLLAASTPRHTLVSSTDLLHPLQIIM